MQAYMDKAGEWFGGLDANMHLYAVCSDDSAADPAFQAFAADKSKAAKTIAVKKGLDTNQSIKVAEVR